MSKMYARPLAMTVLAIALAAGTAGCQTMADLDPTGLLGDDTPAPESQFPTESNQQAQVDANTTTPDLASIPARPPAPDTKAQANTAQQVTAAGTQAQYSADALRAGTDAAAPPPPTAADANATKQALASAASLPPTASDAPPSASDVPPTASDAPPTAGSAPVAAPPPTASPAPSARAAVAPVAVASAAPPQRQPVRPAPPVQNVPVQSAPLAPPPPGTEPAVPAVPGTAGPRMAMINPSDAELGFRPSSAPPLNPSVAQWVSPPILAHYRQTAALAGSAGTGAPAVPAVPAAAGRGGAASGDVTANLDGVPGTPAGMAAAMNGGVPPTAIVYFPGDTTKLPAAASSKVREAVAAFRANGGAGTIKVIGHASSRTGNMSVERHLEVIFQKSQERANAVAQALIKAGVPADKVQIEAVGDSQPVYYESMPKGEEGNRRAEIFVGG
ncbi:MAG TPA: OmpA family protein [Rhizomicrobium sp.]|nr:OmpA family protein [Rhizomicrobium sp.]